MHSMSDFEGFANALGFKGLDVDLFYEAVYAIDNEEYELECALEEYYAT